MRKAALMVIGFLALSAVVGFAVTRPGGFGGGEAGGAADGVTSAQEAPKGWLDPETADQTAGTADFGADPAEIPPGDEVVAGGGSLAGVGELPVIGPRIVKTARLTVEVEKGDFTQAFNAATLVAGKYGGYVQSSSTAGTKTRSGELLIRVPSARFDDALSDLRELGLVKQQSVSGQDVTAEFVDLEARLRTWEAQEVVLLDLMGQARTIEDTLRVQRELQDVQLRIEQIVGQLRLLENQTDLATIQVSIREPGAAVVEPAAREERPSLADAWERALDGFMEVVYVTVVGLGYLVPVTALALVAWFGYRRLKAAPRPSV